MFDVIEYLGPRPPTRHEVHDFDLEAGTVLYEWARGPQRVWVPVPGSLGEEEALEGCWPRVLAVFERTPAI